MESSEIVFIFLPLLYLIMWLKTSQKNFENIYIFEIWWLFFVKGVKTHFGKMPLKWCIFKNDFHKYCLLIGIVLNSYTLYCIWRILQQFIRTLTCKIRQYLLPWIDVLQAHRLDLFLAEVNSTLQNKNSYHIFKMVIFSKIFDDFISYIIRWNAGKKMNPISEHFIKQKFEFKSGCIVFNLSDVIGSQIHGSQLMPNLLNPSWS